MGAGAERAGAMMDGGEAQQRMVSGHWTAREGYHHSQRTWFAGPSATLSLSVLRVASCVLRCARVDVRVSCAGKAALLLGGGDGGWGGDLWWGCSWC